MIHIVLRSLLGAALVVMLVIIVVRTVGPDARGSTVANESSTPSATADPSPTPTPTPTPLPTPTTTTPSEVGAGGTDGGGTDGGGAQGGTTAPVITSFVGPATVACPAPSEAPVPGVDTAEPPYVSFSWTGTGADTAYFGIGTADAELAPYSGVGVDDSISVDFQCANSSVTFAITMIGPGGKTSKTIDVVNTGYVG